jgi:hypothetical protein
MVIRGLGSFGMQIGRRKRRIRPHIYTHTLTRTDAFDHRSELSDHTNPTGGMLAYPDSSPLSRPAKNPIDRSIDFNMHERWTLDSPCTRSPGRTKGSTGPSPPRIILP